jgi:hypothetical protein
MKIFFSGSIKGGQNDIKIYQKIIKYLKSKGNVLTEFVAD